MNVDKKMSSNLDYFVKTSTKLIMELLVTFLNVILPQCPRMQICGLMFLFCSKLVNKFLVSITFVKNKLQHGLND